MFTVRAIRFTCRHVPHDQKLNYHTDGERLSLAPDSDSDNFICQLAIQKTHLAK